MGNLEQKDKKYWIMALHFQMLILTPLFMMIIGYCSDTEEIRKHLPDLRKDGFMGKCKEWIREWRDHGEKYIR